MAHLRILFVGHTTYHLPLSLALARKWDAVSARFCVRVIGRAGRVEGPDDRFRLLRHVGPDLLEGAAFHAELPGVCAREIRRFAPDVVIAQSPYEAFAILPALCAARQRPPLIVEVHGDWRTASRLYGSPVRRAVARLTDRAALAALRSADGTRALTAYTARLGQEATGRPPLGVFPTYFDLESYTERPPASLPDIPTVLWVGVFERYKNPDGFARAWRQVAPRLAGSRLIMVGEGPLERIAEELVREMPERVTYHRRLAPAELAHVYDRAWLLALPSRSEGMGRVILEAFTRGRPVVASAVGGIPDLVNAGRNGLLVRSGDSEGLADALFCILADRKLATRMSVSALEDSRAWRWTAERYAAALEDMVGRVV